MGNGNPLQSKVVSSPFLPPSCALCPLPPQSSHAANKKTVRVLYSQRAMIQKALNYVGVLFSVFAEMSDSQGGTLSGRLY